MQQHKQLPKKHDTFYLQSVPAILNHMQNPLLGGHPSTQQQEGMHRSTLCVYKRGRHAAGTVTTGKRQRKEKAVSQGGTAGLHSLKQPPRCEEDRAAAQRASLACLSHTNLDCLLLWAPQGQHGHQRQDSDHNEGCPSIKQPLWELASIILSTEGLSHEDSSSAGQAVMDRLPPGCTAQRLGFFSWVVTMSSPCSPIFSFYFMKRDNIF